MTRKRFLVFAGFTYALTVIFSFVPVKNLNAVTGSDFRSGNIIDDIVFTNKSSMSPSVIQQFLESKVSGGSCDTNGTRASTRWNSAENRYYTHAEWGALNGNPAPFVCLTTYRENSNTKQTNLGNPTQNIPGSQSAAEIIWNAGQQYNINPQVLIVLLQKEQSLITDDWPWRSQYSSATGAYCPDTAPCDASQAGFGTQVREAARLFRYYMDSPWLYFVGNNFVRYNPNASCGGSNVVIENLATEALYHYTPYQPNAAALNNLYGTGDSCSAYGNRNFWRLFNDWFGSTRQSGKWLRQSSETGQVFVIIEGFEGSTWKRKKFTLNSWDMFLAFRLQFEPVVTVSNSYLDGFEDAGPLTTRLIGQGYGEIQFIDGGNRYFIPSIATCTAWGFSCFDIQQTKTIPGNEFLERLPGLGALPTTMAANNTVFRLENGQKLPIVDQRTFNDLGLSGNNMIYPQAMHTQQPLGPLQISHQIVLSFGNGPFVLYDPNTFQFHPITSLAVFEAWNLPSIAYPSVPASSFSITPPPLNPIPLSHFASDPSGNIYLVDHGKKISINSSQLPAGVTPNGFATSLLNTLPTLQSSGGVLSTNGSVFLLENQQKRSVPTWNDFVGLGLKIQNLVTINDSTAALFTDGPNKLANGSLFQTSGGLFVVSQQQKLHFRSWPYAQDFGVDISRIQNGPENLSSAYPGSSELSAYIQTLSGQKFIITNQTKLVLSAGLVSDWGLGGQTFQVVSDEVIAKIRFTSTFTKFFVYNDMIYYGNGGCKRHVLSYATYQALGGNSSNTPHILHSEIADAIPNCAPLP